MKLRLSPSLLLSAVALGILVLGGCRRGKDPLVLNLLCDNQSKSFPIAEHKLLKFQAGRPKTSSGRPIIVQSVLLDQSKFESLLGDDAGLTIMKPDLVILDSPEQEKSTRAARESNKKGDACNPATGCPTFIPVWVTSDRLDAAEQILKALASGD